jgi:hemerythrin
VGIEWRESLAIGIEEIDSQHKQLLSRFDQLLRACESGQGIDELQCLLTFLDEYVILHFGDEERIQRQHLYPGYAAHKQEHESFIARLQTLKDEICTEGIALHHVVETNSMLLKWLIHHISTVDVQLGKFLKNAAA